VAEYLDLNRANWDDRVPAHVASADYAVQRFLDDPAFLSGVVRFDLPLLGDVSGLRGVHLQCHIGTDTISLARLGASMTGLDFSGAAVAEAARIAAAAGINAAHLSRIELGRRPPTEKVAAELDKAFPEKQSWFSNWHGESQSCLRYWRRSAHGLITRTGPRHSESGRRAFLTASCKQRTTHGR
jgi:transcriptional regulator with XRE-family HTH domain